MTESPGAGVDSPARRLRGWVGGLLCTFIRAYQLAVSPMLGHHCRYAPSCSAYTTEAIAIHGPGRGTWLGLKRVLRCHPWGSSGYDPVPGADA